MWKLCPLLTRFISRHSLLALKRPWFIRLQRLIGRTPLMPSPSMTENGKHVLTVWYWDMLIKESVAQWPVHCTTMQFCRVQTGSHVCNGPSKLPTRRAWKSQLCSHTLNFNLSSAKGTSSVLHASRTSLVTPRKPWDCCSHRISSIYSNLWWPLGSRSTCGCRSCCVLSVEDWHFKACNTVPGQWRCHGHWRSWREHWWS